MIRVLRIHLKKLLSKLESLVPGYLAYCEDCGHIKRLSYIKEVQKFMCHDCTVRYAKLYIKINGL